MRKALACMMRTKLFMQRSEPASLGRTGDMQCYATFGGLTGGPKIAASK